MKHLTYILLFLIPFNGVAQKFAAKEYYLVDSLVLEELTASDKELIENSLKEYHAAKDDTSKVNALNNICENMMHESWEKYQFFQYDLIKNALSTHPSGLITKKLNTALAMALNNIGYIYNMRSDIYKAIEFYQLSLKIREKLNDKEGIAGSFNNIGYIYNNQGDIYKALEYWHKSLKIREELNDKKGIANSFNNIGSIYSNQGDTTKALEYFQKSLKIKEELNDKYEIALSLNNIGYIFQIQGDFPNALKYYYKALEMREELNDDQGIAYSLNNIGTIYSVQGNISKALKHFHNSLKIREELNDKKGIVESLNNIGGTYNNQGKLKLAKKYLGRALKIAKEVGFVEGISISANHLRKLAVKQGYYQLALEMFKLHITMRDSINNEKNLKATAQQQAKYEYEKQKALDDAEHEKQIAIEQEAKAKQQVITFAVAGGLGLVLMFLLFVFNRLRITKKQKLVIEEQKHLVENQKEVVELAHSELEEKNQEIMDSITYAKRIQSAILPPLKIVKEYLDKSFILYKPKDIVAGDFYWMEAVRHSEFISESVSDQTLKQVQGDDIALFAAADCTGHGVPGAMVSVVCNNALNRSVREYGLTEPGEILNKTREIVIQEFEKSDEEVKDGMDIALCSLSTVSSSDSPSGGLYRELKYAGANNPLWLIRDGELLETKANKQPIGKFDTQEPYTTHTIEIQKGDSIYIFSDGYADQFGGEKGKKLKTANFKKLLLSIQKENMTTQKQLIDEAFEKWKGDLEQLDDVCVIGVRV